MLTYKLKYKASEEDLVLINKYVYHYTGLFYKIYNNPELMEDMSFVKENLNEFIDKSIYDSCLIDVKTKLSQLETAKRKKQAQIDGITSYLKDGVFKTRKELKVKYVLINKVRCLGKNINKNVTFGGKALLKQITKLSQEKSNETKLKKIKEEFKEKRKLGLYIVGRACEGGNRKFDFDFKNKKIVFKPNRSAKIDLEFYSRGKQFDVLCNLQELINNNSISITIRLDSEYIYVTFDEQILSGYAFNGTECKKEQKLHINKEVKKQIYIKWKKEQKNKMLESKNPNRYCSVDLNPNYIGISVLDKLSSNPEGVFKIIHYECINLSKLSTRMNLPSDDPKQIKQNNKRRYEITQAWKYIFKICSHYKVAHFGMEDLDFKPKVSDDKKPKEANRKIKNVWHRELTEHLINKHCNILGIDLIKVNPCYSSFIGNMTYNYFDPISSAIEIGRRTIVKYIKKSSIYPNISRINQEKLNYLLGENVLVNPTWNKIYKVVAKLRYRNVPTKFGHLDKHIDSFKSKMLAMR